MPAPEDADLDHRNEHTSWSGGRGVNVLLLGRVPDGYDHGYDAQKFYLRLVLDPRYVEGFVEGCLKRICKDDDGEDVLRDVWKDCPATTGTSS